MRKKPWLRRLLIRRAVISLLLLAQVIFIINLLFGQALTNGWFSLAMQLVSLFLSKSDPLYMQTLHVAAADVRVITLGIFIMAPMYLYRIAIQTLGHPQYPMYAGFLQLAARVFAVTVLPPLIGEYAYYLSTVLAWTVTLPVVVIPFYKYTRILAKTEMREAVR